MVKPRSEGLPSSPEPGAAGLLEIPVVPIKSKELARHLENLMHRYRGLDEKNYGIMLVYRARPRRKEKKKKTRKKGA